MNSDPLRSFQRGGLMKAYVLFLGIAIMPSLWLERAQAQQEKPFLQQMKEMVERADNVMAQEPKTVQEVEATLNDVQKSMDEIEGTASRCSLERDRSAMDNNREARMKDCDRGFELRQSLVNKRTQLERFRSDVNWEKYATREKSLLEQVLNYTTTGDLDGVKSLYFVSGESGDHQCVLTAHVMGLSNSIDKVGGTSVFIVDGVTIDIRQMTPQGWTVREVIKEGEQYYLVGDEKRALRGPITLSVERIKDAWTQAFKECPTGKARPF